MDHQWRLESTLTFLLSRSIPLALSPSISLYLRQYIHFYWGYGSTQDVIDSPHCIRIYYWSQFSVNLIIFKGMKVGVSLPNQFWNILTFVKKWSKYFFSFNLKAFYRECKSKGNPRRCTILRPTLKSHSNHWITLLFGTRFFEGPKWRFEFGFYSHCANMNRAK